MWDKGRSVGTMGSKGQAHHCLGAKEGLADLRAVVIA